jgi:hypothetical protein
MLAAAQAAVAGGLAANVSEWVNAAMRHQAEHDLRTHAFNEFLAHYERKHGVITAAEIRDANQRARTRHRGASARPGVTRAGKVSLIRSSLNARLGRLKGKRSGWDVKPMAIIQGLDQKPRATARRATPGMHACAAVSR